MQNTSVPPPDKPPKLLDQVQTKIRLKHYSIRTEQAYADWIKRYILRHPRDLGASEVEQAKAGAQMIAGGVEPR